MPVTGIRFHPDDSGTELHFAFESLTPGIAMLDPDKSAFESLLQVAITTLLFAALLFLAGLESDPATAKYSPLRTLGITLPH